MTPQTSPERRVRRTEHPSGAIGYYLSARAASTPVRSAVVSQEDGLLLGGFGDLNQDLLAAVGPLFAQGKSVSPAVDGWVEQETSGDDVFSHDLRIDGARLVLTTVGGRLPHTNDISRDLARILRL